MHVGECGSSWCCQVRERSAATVECYPGPWFEPCPRLTSAEQANKLSWETRRYVMWRRCVDIVREFRILSPETLERGTGTAAQKERSRLREEEEEEEEVERKEEESREKWETRVKECGIWQKEWGGEGKMKGKV